MLESRISKDLGFIAKARHLAGGSNDAVSTVLLQTLQKVMKAGIEDVILADDGGICDVVILLESADHIPEKQTENLIRQRIEKLLSSLDLNTPRISYAMLRDNVPSEYQIVRLLSTHAPIDADGLRIQLNGAGFAMPSDKWLNRKLDYLTRNGFLVFQQGLGFAMTESGLSLLPKQEHRNSPDVQRALALARRSWVH